MDKVVGKIQSVRVTAAKVHDLTPAAELLHIDDNVIYADAGYQGIAKRPEMAGSSAEFRVAMRPGKGCYLPDTPEARLQDLIETAKAHIHSKVEHPFRVIKKQFDFQQTRLRGLAKKPCKINVLAALTNLFLARQRLLVTARRGDWCTPKGLLIGSRQSCKAKKPRKRPASRANQLRDVDFGGLVNSAAANTPVA